jgi:hypothetical protein
MFEDSKNVIFLKDGEPAVHGETIFKIVFI